MSEYAAIKKVIADFRQDGMNLEEMIFRAWIDALFFGESKVEIKRMEESDAMEKF